MVDVLRVTNQWNQTNTTWNAQPSFDSTVLDSRTIAAVGGYNFNITNTVKSWYNGSVENDGLVLKAQNENDHYAQFNSAEATYAPKLTVTYKIAPIGEESFWSFDNGINLFGGNLTLGENDVSLAGRGVPISFS